MNQKYSLNIEKALQEGTWVKLICGASNQDLESIGDLCAVYATAGVHCIDVAADPSVVLKAREAIQWAKLNHDKQPWLMISLSDGEDDHFRKAWFDPERCPPDCDRPCENICPAKAIGTSGGVNTNKCYGCGRCITSCPLGLIDEKEHRLEIKNFSPLLNELRPDAIEIHTAPGRAKAFEKAIKEISASRINLERLAVSCGLQGHGINAYQLAQELWLRHQCLRKYDQKPLWQLDGRRMSGDLGLGASRISVNLWKKIKPFAPPGPLQLAGGTNEQTIKLLPSTNGPEGIAFGGQARKIIQPLLLEAQDKKISLREWPEGWERALTKAKQLVNPWLMRN